jgi:hypothetical protein
MNNKFFTQMFFGRLTLGLCLIFAVAQMSFSQSIYFPLPGDGGWERRTAEQMKMDAGRLKEAVDFAVASESKTPRNLELAHYQTFGREPFGEAVGAFKERGAATGNHFTKWLYRRRMGRVKSR